MSSDFVRYSPEIETFDPKAQPGAQHVLDDGVGTPRRLRRQGPHREVVPGLVEVEAAVPSLSPAVR